MLQERVPPKLSRTVLRDGVVVVGDTDDGRTVAGYHRSAQGV